MNISTIWIGTFSDCIIHLFFSLNRSYLDYDIKVFLMTLNTSFVTWRIISRFWYLNYSLHVIFGFIFLLINLPKAQDMIIQWPITGHCSSRNTIQISKDGSLSRLILHSSPFAIFRVLHDLAYFIQCASRKGIQGTEAEASRTMILVFNSFCGSVDCVFANLEGCHSKCPGHIFIISVSCDSISPLSANK